MWNIFRHIAETANRHVSSNNDTEYYFPETYFLQVANKSFETVANSDICELH